MKKLTSVLGLVVAFGSPACKKEPCGGGGIEIDPRPMTEAWDQHIGLPAGATVCRVADGSSPPDQRYFAYLDKEPGALLALLKTQMEEHGWKVVRVEASKGPTSSRCTTAISYEKKKWKAQVSVSECEGRRVPGWATITLSE